MENQGYIKLYRKILDWEWYSDIKVSRLFIHLLVLVNHKDNKWRGTFIKRGRCITSYPSLSKQTGLTVQEIRTALSKLESTGEITRSKSGKNLFVTVLNYHLYQCEQQDNNTITTRYQQDSNMVSTVNKNEKNDKNEIELKDILSCETSNDTSLDGEKAKDNIPYKEIIDYLNEKAGTKYRCQATSTKEKIRARYRDGFTIDDFKTVIDNKCADWKNDAKMRNYLRPETLFGTKFESYLNQRGIEKNEKRERNGASSEPDTRTIDSYGVPILR